MKKHVCVAWLLLLQASVRADMPLLTIKTTTNNLPKAISSRTTYFRGNVPILRNDVSTGNGKIVWQEVLADGKPVCFLRQPTQGKLLKSLDNEYYAWEHDLTGDHVTDLVVLSCSTDPLATTKEAFVLTSEHLLQPIPSGALFDNAGNRLPEYRVLRNAVDIVPGARIAHLAVGLPLKDSEEDLAAFSHVVRLARAYSRGDYNEAWLVHAAEPKLTLKADDGIPAELLIWLGEKHIEQADYDMAYNVLAKAHQLHSLKTGQASVVDPLRLACEYAMGRVALGRRRYPRARAIFERIAAKAGSDSVYRSLCALECAEIDMICGEASKVSFYTLTKYSKDKDKQVSDKATLLVARHLLDVQKKPAEAYNILCDLVLVAGPESLPKARQLRAKAEDLLRRRNAQQKITAKRL